MNLHNLPFILLLFCSRFSIGQAIINSELLEEVSRNELTAVTGFPALHGVAVYKVQYLTIGSDMQPDTASGLVVVPDDTTVVRLLAYQHGTTDGKEDVPSNLNYESLLAKAFAGQGYIVTAADYLGLGDSRGFHPYVHADTEASAGIDLLLAGKDLAYDLGFKTIEQIFITGYSQGGHAAMAMARAVQERPTDDLWVTAAAPMSGPYSISGIMRNVILQDTQAYNFPAYVIYSLLGYQEIYGNLYDSIEQVFKPVFTGMIHSFYDHQIDLDILNQFLINQLINDEGMSIPKALFNESFLTAILSDSLHPVNLALNDNDTYQWAPLFPFRMYYCKADDQVSYLNSLVAEEYMNSQGAPDVKAIDVFPSGDHGGCVVPAVLSTLGFFNEISLSTRVEESIAFQDLTVFPNPVSDLLQMALPSDLSAGRLQIYNQWGVKVVDHNGLYSQEINVRYLPEGMYHLVLRNTEGSWRGSFIIHR